MCLFCCGNLMNCGFQVNIHEESKVSTSVRIVPVRREEIVLQKTDGACDSKGTITEACILLFYTLLVISSHKIYEKIDNSQCNAQICTQWYCESHCPHNMSSRKIASISSMKSVDVKAVSPKKMMFGVFPEGHNSKPGDNELKDNLLKEEQNNIIESSAPDNAECTSAHLEGNVSQAAKSNFFIDASTLLDETEVKVQNSKGDGPPPEPPPPLIRRKTFELDADEDKVAVLRQEYERRQGNLLFQSCGTDAPLSLPLGLPHLMDDDVHTPDSLNNDIVSTEGLDNVEETAELESFHLRNDDLNRNELVSPAPSPVGDYIAIHKDSIDASSILDDDVSDSNHATDNGHAHTDESEQTDNSLRSSSHLLSSNKIDAMPIVSGGVPPEKVQSPMFSRRKIESAPILSGAAPPILPEPSIEEKPKKMSVSSLASAWVVDISDMVSPPESRQKKDKQAESKSLTSSLGFFIDLKDKPSDQVLSGSCGPSVMRRSTGNGSSSQEWKRIEVSGLSQSKVVPPRKIQNNVLRQLSTEDRGSRQSCSEDSTSRESPRSTSTDLRQSPLPVRPKVVHSPDQKLFTMFIGLDKDETITQRQERPSRRRNVDENSDGQTHSHKSKYGSDTELSTSSTDDKSSSGRKQPVYMYIKSESPSSNRKIINDQDSGYSFKKQHTRAKSMSTSAAAVFPDSRDDYHTQPNSLLGHSLNDGTFVRLSDLDKTPNLSPNVSEMTNPFASESKRRSWKPRSAVPNCSVSLARVFPVLKEGSLTSSMGVEVEARDNQGSSEFWQELKQMFLNNVCPDVIVEVAGRRIGAHKIVLTHRCPYFAAALSGGWVESGGNVIRLRGFSYPAVHFALYHIYVGTLSIPEHMNIVELAMLCDLFHLDSLKETVEQEISRKMCHSFHDPQTLKCACIPGVFETLVLAASYNLECLYPKCLHWSCSHFYKVCQTLPFVTLPSEVKDKILKTIVSNCEQEDLTAEETLELKVFTAVNASRLVLWCGRADWALTALPWFHRLKDETHKLVAKVLNTVITNTPSFHLLVRDMVDSVLLQSVHFLSPEELCLVYRTLFSLRREENHYKYPEGARLVLENLFDGIVVQLVAQASKVIKARAWDLLEVEMQTPILEKAGYPLRHQFKALQRSATDDKTFPRRDRGSILWNGPNPNRLQNLKQVKQVIALHVNRANQGTLDPVPIRRSAVPVPEKVQIRPAVGVVKKREVKARYLEMKSRPTKPKTNESSADVSFAQRHSYCAPATATSSDSSAITPTESLSDAAVEKPVPNPRNRFSVQDERLLKPKETKRPMSGPTKQLAASWNAPRRCASSSLVESAKSSSTIAAQKPVVAKERHLIPPGSTTKAKRAGLTLSTSTRSSTSVSTSASAPATASTSFSKSAPKLAKPTPPATAPIVAPGTRSRLNIPLRTSRSSSSVPQSFPPATRREPCKTAGENATSKSIQTRPASKTAPLKPLNGPRGPREPPKRVNGFTNKCNTRTGTVACETADLTNRTKSPKTALRLSLSKEKKGGAQTSISTSDMATDTSDIPPTPDVEQGRGEGAVNDLIVMSRSGTFLKDEPTVLRKQTSDET